MPEPHGQASVNGEPQAVVGLSVDALLDELDLPGARRGVAVAIDGEVVPRGAWADRRIAADEQVEVLTAIQGG